MTILAETFNNVYGFKPSGVIASESVQMNTGGASNGKMQFGFVLNTTKTLNSVSVLCNAINTTTNFRCDLYPGDCYGSWSSSIHSSAVNTTTGSLGFINFTGFDDVLTAGVPYFLMVYNMNDATPRTFTSFKNIAPNHIFNPGTSNSNYMHNGLCNTLSYGGSQSYYSGGSFRLNFSDSSYAGLPVTGAGDDNTIKCYDNLQFGTTLRTPLKSKLEVIGAGVAMKKTGTINPVIKIYQGTTLLGTTGALQNGANEGYLSSVLELPIDTDIRIVSSTSNGTDGDVSNFVYPYYVDYENTAASRALKPLDNNFQFITSSDGGASFTNGATNRVIPAWLILKEKELTTGNAASQISRISVY